METESNKEYAGKGVAGTGLGLGIAGTALGLLGGGLGGGLFGGNQMTRAATEAAGAVSLATIAEKDSRIAQLESERYTDHQVQDAMRREACMNERISELASNNEKRIAALEVAAPLREQLLQAQISSVAQTASCGINAVNTSLNNLAAVVSSVTKVVIPNSNVCPGWGDVTITPATSTTVTA